MLNSETFLGHFREIEQRLRAMTGLSSQQTFYQLVGQAASKDAGVRRYQNDLRKFGDLRNSIVHESRANITIAEPNDWAVQRIAEIADHILRPPHVDVHFLRKVETLPNHAPIAQAVSLMHDLAFSQVPIYNERQFVGLLTTNTIARWLGANARDDLVSLSDTTIQQVLSYTEYHDHVAFVARNETLIEAQERFISRDMQGRRLDALIITQDGRRDTSPLGIIVAYDLTTISRVLDS